MNESRFYMWRAVFALAHADGIVTDKERAFIEGYLDRLPLSDEQKEIIRSDLKEARGVNEMLIGVRDKGDQADFFQFAQMMIWCDGNLAEQEKVITGRLMSEQMNKFNKAAIAEGLRQGHMAARLRRSIEDDAFKRQAGGTGLFAGWRRGDQYNDNFATIAKTTARETGREVADILGFKVKPADEEETYKMGAAMEWMRQQAFSGPSDEIFSLWRAVFALVNADGKVTAQEREYIEGMMQIFRFSRENKAVIEGDLQANGNIVPLFRKLKTPELRRQYFAMARTVVWADWEFSNEERDVMKSLVASLDRAEKISLAADLDWIEEKPLPPAPSEDNEAPTMKRLFSQMVGFSNKYAKFQSGN
jgi:uncharacterized membrane protein YebE (DUF533 family)